MEKIDVNKVKVRTEKGAVNQTPASDQRAVVRYTTETGVEVKLSPAIIKKYLVSGDPTAVTDEEVMMFLQLCRFQKLNPFLREAYLIKYSRKYPASLVTGKDVFLKRAQRIKECKGFRAGLILLKDDTVKYTDGLILPGWELIGGWSEVTKEGWSQPARLEVNFSEYVGTKSDGSINSMWTKKPGTMIRKVPLAQNLREVFPEELGKLYMPEEMPGADAIDETPVIQEEAEIGSQRSEVRDHGAEDKKQETGTISKGTVVDVEVVEDEMEKFAHKSKKITDEFLEEVPAKDTTRKLNVLVGKVMKQKDDFLPEHFEMIKSAVEGQREKLKAVASGQGSAGSGQGTENTDQGTQTGLNKNQIAMVENQMDDLTPAELFKELGVEGWHEIDSPMTAIGAIGRIQEKRQGQF